MTRPGEVYGTPGGSLGKQNFTTADRASVGQRGEEKTARLLADLATRGATVLHDLRVPIPGFTANIDHVVVSGHRVTILDSKVWKPGRYWTFAGRTRRGFEKVPHTDKKLLPTAQTALDRYLKQAGVGNAHVGTGLLLIWPSSKSGRLKLGLYKPAGAKALDASAHTTPSRIRAHTGIANADPKIIATLAPLIIS